MKLRLEFHKLGMIKFISHLDTVRVFQRAFMRAKIPILWSEGFNPHPKMSIATPLSLGVESESETIDIEVDDNFDYKNIKKELNQVLPKGIEIIRVADKFDDTSVFLRVDTADYELFFPKSFDLDKYALIQGVEYLKKAEKVLIPRQRKRGKKKITIEEDILPLINNLKVIEKDNGLSIFANVSASHLDNLRPDRLLLGLKQCSILDFDPDLVQIKRLRTYDKDGSEIHV